MAMASLVYPGAVHSRLHHALGAYHLMTQALEEISNKGIEITPQEKQAAQIAILLHDIGHGPFSHALEQTLAEGMSHEALGILIMKKINEELGGALAMAIEIFENTYRKKFLHQLVSGQLDVDRMDYLTRDSFFSGVSEGVIGYDRIIKMLTVHEGQLMVEEKGIYSIEKFLVARRLMYWQAYLHKTVLSAEQMLKQVIRRARYIKAPCQEPLNSLINDDLKDVTLEEFCSLDDTDVMMALKLWSLHEDKVLSLLCNGLLNRNLLKVRFLPAPPSQEELAAKKNAVMQQLLLSEDDVSWLVYGGEAMSNTYNFKNAHINILFKDGTVKDITEVDHALIHQNLQGDTKKYYICFPGQQASLQ